MQTTWDDPDAGEPRIVPSRLVKQTIKGVASTNQGVTQQQVDALPHVHSQLGDLNVLSMKALRNICVTRDLATRGRRVDLVCRLIGHDVAQAATRRGSAWQTAGHARLGELVCRPRAVSSSEKRDQANPDAETSSGADELPSRDASAESSADPIATDEAASSATVRGAITAWKPAHSPDDVVQFYVVLHDGSEEALSEDEVEAAAAAYQASFGGKKSHVKGGRARHGERARARDNLNDFRLGKWSDNEVAKLDEALADKDLDPNDWHAISARVGTRSHLQVYDFQRRRLEAARKRRESEDKALLEPVIQQYLTDHSLAEFDKTSVGITATCIPKPMMDWLTSKYGEEAPTLAAKFINFCYPSENTEAMQSGQPAAEGDGNMEDYIEYAGDAGNGAYDGGNGSGKRKRASKKGLAWTAAEERHLETLMKSDGQSTASKWQEKAAALGTLRSGNSVQQRWNLIQAGGGVLTGDGTVSRSWPTGAPTFESFRTESVKKSAGGTYVVETNLVDVNCYKIDAEKAFEIRITAENPPRISVYDLVKIICNLGARDTVDAEDKQRLFEQVPEISRCASKRNRSQSWLAAKWRYIDRIIAWCAAISGEAHADEAKKFRSTSAFTLLEKLITALQQQGPAHPVAHALQSQTAAAGGESGAHGNGTVASLPNEAEFRRDLKKMCRDRTLVGQRLSIYWGGDQSWYTGRVTECRRGRQFKVQYDDGETSWESVEVQIGVRFLDAPAKRPAAAPRAPKEKRKAIVKAKHNDTPVEEIQEWKVLNFINSEPYEPSDIRLTGEQPPRIALRDFLECVLDVETGSETKQKKVVKHLRKKLKKSAVQEYIFVDEKGQEDQTEVVALTELGKIFPLLPSELTNRVRETGDLHRLQKILRQETGVADIEMSVEAPGPGPILQAQQVSRGGRGSGKAGQVAADVNLQDWQEMWSPVLCLPSDDTRDGVAAAARNSDPYVDPAPASLRLESRQLMTQASGHASLPGATSRHPGHIRLPSAPTAELRWLCTTGNLTGRRVSVYWPKDDLWYDGTVEQCQPGRFKLAYDCNRSLAAGSAEPAVVRWEILGIGVHLLTRLPVGETMRKMFATRSRMVNGRGRSVHTAPRLKHRPSLGFSLGAPNTTEDDESELDPIALAMLMAPSFRVGSDRSSGKTAHTITAGMGVDVMDEDEDAGDTSAWTPSEEALLRQVVVAMGAGRWEAKVATMNSKRSWMALALRYSYMIRRQKNDPLLKRGFRTFSASPSAHELKAARSALGIPEPQHSCEACGASHDGSYGTGRFCSQSCKNAFSARIKNNSTGAGPTEPSKRDERNEEKYCEACGESHDGSYGAYPENDRVVPVH